MCHSSQNCLFSGMSEHNLITCKIGNDLVADCSQWSSRHCYLLFCANRGRMLIFSDFWFLLPHSSKTWNHLWKFNSAYRSWEVNKKAGGSSTSNHLVGCAADIKCLGKEQALRYAVILLDIADESREDFDELIIEVRGSTLWIHFAVRPKGNRRKIVFDVK